MKAMKAGPDKGNDGGDLHFREAQSAVAAEGRSTAREPAAVAAETAGAEAAPVPPAASTSDAAALGVAPQMVSEPRQGTVGVSSGAGWPRRLAWWPLAGPIVTSEAGLWPLAGQV